MSTPELWSGVGELVACWAGSPHVRGLREELWKDLDSNEALRPLQIMALREPQNIRSMPLAVFKAFPHMNVSLTPRDRQFMTHCAAVEKAIVYLVWAVRSRLPGFPMIAAPQLAEHSRLTMDNFTPPWTRDAMRSGLQYKDLSPNINASVGVDSTDQLSQLIAGFNTLPAWRTFAAAHHSLTPSLRSELLGARRRITERAIGESSEIDSDDPWTKIKRARTSADEIIAELPLDAMSYAVAFDHVNDEIDLAIAKVIASSLAFGPADTISGVVGLSMLPGQPLKVTFQLKGTEMAHTGRLYWTNDSLITDALLVEGVHFTDDQIHGSRLGYDATVLVGSNTAWRGAAGRPNPG
jgi:hypothetical protein